ncbi:indole-3-glycerol phosphate synthase [Actinomycetota bacterium]|nr:indole-3-glycerol phosphate synthase [Actinomycetota bacterium]
MTDILKTIAADTRRRVDLVKTQVPYSKLKQQALALTLALAAEKTGSYPFEEALAKSGLSVIAEVKKASPSKGLIDSDFDYLAIAQEYAAAGAAAISVLTEPNFFRGSPEYLRQIAAAVPVPVLRKDFIIDDYQIYESKVLGASAILLICSLLTSAQLADYLAVADVLGLSALVEAHDADEIKRALAVGARVIGVNNRDLATFNVDITTSQRLRELVPAQIFFVSESGIKTPEDAAQLAVYGVDAVLIGESLMRCSDKHGFINRIRQLQAQTD